MRVAASSSQLLLRSFGYGIFQARTVPSEIANPKRPSSNSDRMRAIKALERRIRRSGIPNVQEIVPDPEDPETAYVLVREGQPPCKLERGQWEQADLDRLSMAVEAAVSGRFSERLTMLQAPDVTVLDGDSSESDP